VVFATFISLVLVPSGYMIAEDLRNGIHRLLGGAEEGVEESAAEAAP
jgi:hypothetical protein